MATIQACHFERYTEFVYIEHVAHNQNRVMSFRRPTEGEIPGVFSIQVGIWQERRMNLPINLGDQPISVGISLVSVAASK